MNPVTKPSQIILDKGLVLDKESRASTLLCRSTGKTLLSGVKHQSLHSAMKKKLSVINHQLLATVLLLPLALASASGQTLAPIRKLPLNEPLEKYNMPPAPPRKIETSPRMISQFGVFTSFQANVDANGNNILGDCANEPSISVDPTDGNKMVIAWRQFDSINSDFRQAGWGYTTDGGMTWTFPGVLENNIFRSDPVTHSDETGNFFYLSLQSDQAQSFFCDDVWRSTNGGQTSWSSQPDGAGHGGDKEWFTIDKTGGTGHGFQYQFWTGFFACDSGEFTRSTDGGVTWHDADQSSELYRYRSARRGHERQSFSWRRREPVLVPSLVNAQNGTSRRLSTKPLRSTSVGTSFRVA